MLTLIFPPLKTHWNCVFIILIFKGKVIRTYLTHQRIQIPTMNYRKKNMFQSVPIVALCLYNIQRENLIF